MAKLILNGVTVDFPIYGVTRNLRHALFAGRIGGTIRRNKSAQMRAVVRGLEDVNLALHDGDRLALIGHNGAGKSTLLRVMAGAYEPTQGSIEVEGNVSALIQRNTGFELDDTGYECIASACLLHGMTKEQIQGVIPSIAEFTELGDFLSLPLRTYSSGMMMRLSFAIATSLAPQILLLDEEFGTGDARFTERAKERIEALIERSNILVFASHSFPTVRALCNKGALVHHGRVLMVGPVDEIIERYQAVNRQDAGVAVTRPPIG